MCCKNYFKPDEFNDFFINIAQDSTSLSSGVNNENSNCNFNSYLSKKNSTN